MKQTLKSRKTAAVVLAAAVLLAVFISAATDCAAVEKLFYEGVKYDGYRHSSVYDNLSARVSAANGLVSIAVNHADCEAAGEALRTARRELADAEEIADMYAADCALQEAYEALVPVLEGAALDADEREDAEYYMQNMNGARLAITESGYNERVEGLDRGLLRLLGGIGLVDVPESFG